MKSCATCARADCELVTSPADCGQWTNDEDTPTADEIAADLAPLSREEYR